MVDSGQIGHYHLLGPIGKGGFATVFKAIDERFDSPVAIKILAENHSLDPLIRERFLTEAQLLRRAACSAVIAVYDIGENDRNQPFMALAFADRGDLASRLDELQTWGQTVSEHEALQVVDTLALALSKVHAAGVVHRDVKPDNLLIASDGVPRNRGGLLAPDERLYLSDLGFAKDLEAGTGLTRGGGTQGFSAPEQRVGLGKIDSRADIYGASALLYWLLTNKTPSMSVDHTRKPLTERNATPSLVDAVMKGLSEEPEDRFGSIEEWHAALTNDRARPGGLVLVAPTGLPSESGERATGNKAKWRRWVWPAALALSIGIAGGLLWMQSRLGDPVVGVLDDGRVSVEQQQGDLRVAVFGPAEVSVGEPATFEAGADGASSLVWISPDGSVVADQNSLSVTLDEAGPAVVTLVATGPDGSTSVDFAIDASE